MAFYRAFLRDLGRGDEVGTFQKGGNKYLNEQGKTNDPTWLTAYIKECDIAPVVRKISSLK